MFDPKALIQSLHRHGVKYVIVGGVAAEIHGSEQKTGDLDICYERSDKNIEALATAISRFSARLRGVNLPASLPFRFDEPTIRMGLNCTLEATAVSLDLLGEVSGIGDYAAVYAVSEEVLLYEIACRVLSIDALIKSKRAAGRPKDIPVILELEAIKVLKGKRGEE